MKIRPYKANCDFDQLLDVLISEGEEWSCYSSEENKERYKITLKNSVVYVAEVEGTIVGYCRSLIDIGYQVLVCDLLVHKDHRGKEIGRQLMEVFLEKYPGYEVYVMSDVDPYYEKLGYKNEGTLFRVARSQKPEYSS